MTDSRNLANVVRTARIAADALRGETPNIDRADAMLARAEKLADRIGDDVTRDHAAAILAPIADVLADRIAEIHARRSAAVLSPVD